MPVAVKHSSDKIYNTNLVKAANMAAEMLLAISDVEELQSILEKTMELLGVSVDVHHVYIWKKEQINGNPHFVNIYQWESDVEKQVKSVDTGTEISCDTLPVFDRIISKGEVINCPVSQLSDKDKVFLGTYNTKSIVILPLVIQDSFWGFLSLGDCVVERYLTKEEVDILRSVSLMMVSAINHHTQAMYIRAVSEQTNLLLDTTPLGASLWNRDARMFLCNDELVKLFDTGTKEECCKRFFDFTPKYQPDGELSIEKAERYIKEAFETGKCNFKWLHALPDGTPMPGEVTFVRVEYERDYVVAAYFRDLREQTAMMEDIERRDYLLETINNVSSILLQTDAEHFIKDLHSCMGLFARALDIDHISIWKNTTIEEELYYYRVFEWTTEAETPETAIYKPDSLFSDENLRCYRTHVPHLYFDLRNGIFTSNLVRDLPDIERNFFSAQGIRSISVAPIFIQDNFWGIVSYRSYHYERLFTESEQAIMQSGSLVIANALFQNEMKVDLMSSAVQLEEAFKEAKRADRAKSEFLARVSHEIRTPLNAVLGLAWLSLESDKLDRDAYSNLEKIYDSGTTILNLVNEVLDISKIESGVLELESYDYELPGMLNDAVAQNLPRIGDKPVKFKLSITADSFMYLNGDELRVKQIINNLLSNAIKYTGKGEIELFVDSIREDDVVWLTIKVKDSGRGIKKKDLTKLFDDYVRLEEHASHNIEGIGLGLSITKKLCDLMQGTITVESKYGKGSTFTVTLMQSFVSDEKIDPVVIESLTTHQYSRSKSARTLRRNTARLPYAHVLLVDDNLTNLEIAKGLFMPYEMKIDCVSSGKKAIEAISTELVRYDAVFLDQMMPGMDGVEAAERIRNLGTDYAKNLPIIAFTANVVSENEEYFLSQGFQDFLTKPIDIPKLDDIIMKWIYNKEKEASYVSSGEHRVDNEEKDIKKGSVFPKDLKIENLSIQDGIKRFGNNERTYLHVLRTYASDTRDLLMKITSVDESKIHDYEIIVHGIKGSSKDICALELGTLAEQLENAAKNSDIGFLTEHNPRFLSIAQALISGIDKLIEHADRDNSMPMKEKPDSELLVDLLKACESFDIDEVDAIMAKIKLYQYTNDDGLSFWLQEKADLMKFSEITKKISSL